MGHRLAGHRCVEHGDTAQAVAAVTGRVGTVENLHPVDFPGLYHIPAGSRAKVGTEKITEQQTVAVNQCARGLEVVHIAEGKQAVAVADKAFPYHQVGLVLDHVFAVGSVDVRHLVSGDLTAQPHRLTVQRGGGLADGNRFQFVGVQ